MRSLRKAGSIYRRTGRVYRRWSGSLLALAALVFVPLGLLDALSTQLNASSLELGTAELAAVVAALVALGTTSLLGQIFYSGAVAISLNQRPDEPPLPLAKLARQIDYGRLILVDLLYVTIVIVGLVLFVVPGLLAFVWFTLAGPVIEIEHRGVRAALRRSYQLVRGNFLAVALVVVPVEVGGDLLSEGLGWLVHHELGESLPAVWLAEAAANVLVTPVFAVAVALLTIDLIAAKDGRRPGLNQTPAAAEITSQ